jgi:hypothetical protein
MNLSGRAGVLGTVGTNLEQAKLDQIGAPWWLKRLHTRFRGSSSRAQFKRANKTIQFPSLTPHAIQMSQYSNEGIAGKSLIFSAVHHILVALCNGLILHMTDGEDPDRSGGALETGRGSINATGDENIVKTTAKPAPSSQVAQAAQGLRTLAAVFRICRPETGCGRRGGPVEEAWVGGGGGWLPCPLPLAGSQRGEVTIFGRAEKLPRARTFGSGERRGGERTPKEYRCRRLVAQRHLGIPYVRECVCKAPSSSFPLSSFRRRWTRFEHSSLWRDPAFSDQGNRASFGCAGHK